MFSSIWAAKRVSLLAGTTTRLLYRNIKIQLRPRQQQFSNLHLKHELPKQKLVGLRQRPSGKKPTRLVFTIGVSLGAFKLNVAECKINTKGSSRVLVNSSIEDKSPEFNVREFLKFLWPEIWSLLLAVITAIGAAIVNVQIPVLLGELIQVVSKFTTEAEGNFMQEIYNPAIKLLTAYGMQSLATSGYIILLANIGERIASNMRKKLFNSLINQDIQFFDSHKTGELINRLSADVQDFKSSFKLCISQGVRSTTQIVGCVVSLYWISPQLTGVMTVVMPCVVIGGAVVGSILRKFSKAVQEQVAIATSVASEALGNVRTVRAFAMETKEAQLYAEQIDKCSALNEQLGLGIGLFQGLTNFVLNGIVLGVLYCGGYLMANHQLKPGELMSFLVAAQTVQRSMASMSILFGQAVRGISAGARVFEYILLEPTMPALGGKKIPFHSMYGTVEFKGVNFSYPTRPEQEVLKNFDLKMKHGEVVALCGPSGGGKSTIASLLERFYDVDSGTITIDGYDLKTFDPSWLRGRAIGFINQEPVLFATSIMENIRYGKPEATDKEVQEAAVLANAHEFIRRFPDGYNTIVGERGITVSGGQKQRIALARALLKNPSILILDEATSALDAESERLVQEALDRVSRGRTVLVIAHRLSTIRKADVIAVLVNGVIQEMGSHDKLLKKNGIYKELIQRQTIEE
ncbi:mitochondrial potassium channel ATP-binding subunit-like [Anneissia japonica]|uniref:mitochondrial potassium channel ATP-binding subunit-like n=1 Tax=Anneissia japonica TaxID=1529436 RepID=UPI001425923D|nr:mitochondrial potassium channel ATP-binding subunit-like [Anneissia japonica]